MGWKVKILLLWTFLMPSLGQMVLIGDNLGTPANEANASVTEIGELMRTNDEESHEESRSSKGQSLEDHNRDVGSDLNTIPGHESNENGNSEIVIPERESAKSSSKEQSESDAENNLASDENEKESNEEHQSNEGQSSNEQISVVRSSEEVEGSSQISEENIVTTTHGPVQGFPWNESPDIISFLDIPYGTVSSMFQAPELPNTWKEARKVYKHKVHCPQVQVNAETRAAEVTGQLDCLTLSVFALKDTDNADVLFHIHDGSFITGSGDPSIYGPEFLLSRGIVLVLPNYRLGPLGFLCLQNETAPGNAALKDLTLALNWTIANIAAFGGNPDNIVISGDGISGALAGYLALSPASKDYVSKVIVESGSVVSHWALDRDPITTATTLAEKVRILYKNQTFNESLFQEIGLEKLILGSQGIHLRPCVENGSDSFITDSPWFMLHEQKNSTSFMIGSASFAGLHEALSHDADSISQLNEDFGYLMPDDLYFEKGKDEMLEVANKVKKQYFGDSAISQKSDELALVHTDASYLGPVIRAARVLVEAGATVYFYEFAFVGALNREREALGSQVNGSARGDIVGYLFTQGGQLPEKDSEEDKMVNLMTDLWTSFMHNGTPSSDGVEWNQLESTAEAEEQWLWIGSETQARKGLHVERLHLWTSIYDEHFVERNPAKSVAQNPALIVIAISALGLLPKSMQVSRYV